MYLPSCLQTFQWIFGARRGRKIWEYWKVHWIWSPPITVNNNPINFRISINIFVLGTFLIICASSVTVKKFTVRKNLKMVYIWKFCPNTTPLFFFLAGEWLFGTEIKVNSFMTTHFYNGNAVKEQIYITSAWNFSIFNHPPHILGVKFVIIFKSFLNLRNQK